MSVYQSEPMASIVEKIYRGWETMTRVQREEANRHYRDLADLDYLCALKHPVACHDCAKPRVLCGGERGSVVLHDGNGPVFGGHWLCDPCTLDNRAAVQGEAQAAHGR